MKLRTTIARVSAAAMIFALPWFLALTSLLPLISPAFLRLQYARPDVPPSSIFTPEERQTVAEAAAHYLISGEGIDYLANITGADGTPLFNDRELTHMVDVKILLGKAIKLDLGLALVLAVSLAILLVQEETRHRMPFYLVVGALVAPTLAVAAMIVVPLQFGWFFVEFHHLFFAGESWLFPRSDTLIQLFPEQFWFDALQAWLFLIVAGSVALAVGAYAWMRRKRRTTTS
ncbi:MAG TPA: TIGR01906 family membrane protein [Anaerolineae bacterium]|nr:TIGR01906 family membrane protein [Anaerolineae bacterium]